MIRGKKTVQLRVAETLSLLALHDFWRFAVAGRLSENVWRVGKLRAEMALPADGALPVQYDSWFDEGKIWIIRSNSIIKHSGVIMEFTVA